MFLNETNDMINELLSGRWIVDQPAVLVTLAVIPSSKSKGYLDAMLLKFGHFPVHVFARVSWNKEIKLSTHSHILNLFEEDKFDIYNVQYCEMYNCTFC